MINNVKGRELKDGTRRAPRLRERMRSERPIGRGGYTVVRMTESPTTVPLRLLKVKPPEKVV